MAEIGKIVLNSGWLAARFSEINLTGVQLTTTHPPSGSFSPWMSALVPGTVLATLVENKELPDPFYGLKNKEIIDIADSGRDYYTFCFFTKFECKLAVNQHVDLNFRAINYFAEVYLNGHKRVLGKGMFRRHSLDVTDILSPVGQNLLAVIVHPPDHPGRIPTTGGQGGDHEIIVGNEPRLAISNSNDIETTTERTTSVSNDHDKEVESIVDDSSSITPIKRNFTAMTEERVEDMHSTTKRIVEIKREKI